MDRGAWWTTVHEVTKRQTRLSDWTHWTSAAFLLLFCIFKAPLPPHFISVSVAHSCPTLCDPMDYTQPGFLVHRILQARTLEWVPISFSRGSSQPRDQTWISCITGRFSTIWATREAPKLSLIYPLHCLLLKQKRLKVGVPKRLVKGIDRSQLIIRSQGASPSFICFFLPGVLAGAVGKSSARTFGNHQSQVIRVLVESLFILKAMVSHCGKAGAPKGVWFWKPS